MFEIVAKIKVAKSPQHTDYYWGDKSEIAGKYLNVLEVAKDGACLCVNDKGLVDVHKEDIEEFKEVPNVKSFLEQIEKYKKEAI